jgi:hypothetical protein
MLQSDLSLVVLLRNPIPRCGRCGLFGSRSHCGGPPQTHTPQGPHPLRGRGPFSQPEPGASTPRIGTLPNYPEPELKAQAVEDPATPVTTAKSGGHCLSQRGGQQ